MNIPNLITVIRILLVPLLAWFILHKQHGPALLIFVVAGISDALDGLLARLLNQRTRLGSLLDPIADKALLTTSFLVLALTGIIPLWPALVVLARDLTILTGVALLMGRNSKLEISPTRTGKLTTFVQISTVAAVLGADLWPEVATFGDYLLIATLAVTIVSWLQYLTIGSRILKNW